MECPENWHNTDCPCFLAETGNCNYCSLLQGKPTCNCDWQGFCAYENYNWQKVSPPEINPNTIWNTVSYPNATGLFVKVNQELCGLPLGTIVEVKPETMKKYSLQGVVLRSYPTYTMLYLLTLSQCPSSSLRREKAKISARHNAFLGGHILNAAENKTIAVFAGKDAALLLGPLVSALEARRNRVYVHSLASDLAAVEPIPDIVFIAGLDNEIKKVASHLPPSYQTKVVVWPISE